jgi:hypothetical protein
MTTFALTEVSPLQWWRQTEPKMHDATANAALRAILSDVAMLGEPGWHAAARGDAAKAVRIALRTACGRPAPLAVDLAGTALLLCASEGNAAALVALHHLRRRFASFGAANNAKSGA